MLLGLPDPSLSQLATDGQTWTVAASADSIDGPILGPTGPDLDVFVARSTDGGASWSAPVAVNTNAAMDGASIDGGLVLAANDQRQWVAAWTSNTTLGATIGSDFDILTVTSFAESGTEFIRGDCNGDGNVDITDPIVNLTFQFIGGEVLCRKACDFDDSSAVDITDANLNLSFQLLGTAPPEPPGLTCGPDPTPDDGLHCNNGGSCQ